MNFSSILKKLMDDCNISIPDLARQTNIPDSTIRNSLKRNSDSVALEVAFKLSRFFNVSLSYLNGDESDAVCELPTNGSENILGKELDFIKKYRSLDPRGQQAVEDTLNREFSYSANRVDADIATDMIKTIKKVEQNLINQPVPTDKK